MKKFTVAFAVLIAATAFRSPDAAAPDKAFMIRAAQSNLAEIGAAKMALTQSGTDSIKTFAQMMIDEHTKAQSDLASLAQSQGVTLPDSTDVEHREFAKRLMLVSGGAFDTAYVKSQVNDHVKTIALFESEVAHGNNAEDKAFATKLLPNLKMHLQHANSLAGSKVGMAMPQ